MSDAVRWQSAPKEHCEGAGWQPVMVEGQARRAICNGCGASATWSPEGGAMTDKGDMGIWSAWELPDERKRAWNRVQLAMRALEVVLGCDGEFDVESGEGFQCPACEGNVAHATGCEWAAVVAEAKRLGMTE